MMNTKKRDIESRVKLEEAKASSGNKSPNGFSKEVDAFAYDLDCNPAKAIGRGRRAEFKKKYKEKVDTLAKTLAEIRELPPK